MATIIEIQDSPPPPPPTPSSSPPPAPPGAECEEDGRPSSVKMEEKLFISSLYSFMKDKGSPIERIPHLGFKQINLWRIYKAVEKLGGYDSVTARRLWKNVYDELGGSPGSTSAATCTRRHYERLVLPFERHLKGEEDKPLPPSKPRKPYKRHQDAKVGKEAKKKRTEHGLDPELLAQGSSDAAGGHAHAPLWAADRPQPGRGPAELCPPLYARAPLVHVRPPSPWTGLSASVAGEVISPLEKKKRVAQASLSLCEDKDRPSVIRCSPSPAVAPPAGHTCNSSEGSPLPASSSSSRGPSPCSLSSEEAPVEDKATAGTELSNKSSSRGSESTGETPKDSAGQKSVASPTRAHSVPADLIKTHLKDSDWRQIQRHEKVRNLPYQSPLPMTPPHAQAVKSNWVPASNSSFSKVIPKSAQLLRPAALPLGYKGAPCRLVQQDDSLACVRKMMAAGPWLYQPDKRDKPRMVMPKPLDPQQGAVTHSRAPLSVSYVLAGFDKAAQDSRLQAPPLIPAFLPGRVRLPQVHPMHGQVPAALAHHALSGSARYAYPYPLPVWSPHAGYALPAINSVYPHKL